MEQYNMLASSSTSARSRRSAPADSPASAPASKCATCTPRTTAASARSTRRKARTSVSSCTCHSTRAPMNSASSRRRTSKVKNGKVTKEIVYLNALEEEKDVIAHAATQLDDNGRIIESQSKSATTASRSSSPATRSTLMDVVDRPAILCRDLDDPVRRARRREPRT